MGHAGHLAPPLQCQTDYVFIPINKTRIEYQQRTFWNVAIVVAWGVMVVIYTIPGLIIKKAVYVQEACLEIKNIARPMKFHHATTTLMAHTRIVLNTFTILPHVKRSVLMTIILFHTKRINIMLKRFTVL